MGVLTRNFSLWEFKCKCCGQVHMNFLHVERLQKFRDFIQEKEERECPIHVNSGYRCISHNTEIGGTSDSKHLLGLASDIYSSEIPVESLIQHAIEFGEFGGVIGYVSRGFVHLDSRDLIGLHKYHKIYD
jgi:zinc D-Ala-D-Ala carboxypeptidase